MILQCSNNIGPKVAPKFYVKKFAFNTKLFYLETATNIVDRHVTLVVLVNNLEPLDVRLNLLLGQRNRDLVPRLPIHLQSHLIGQELVGRSDLFLK